MNTRVSCLCRLFLSVVLGMVLVPAARLQAQGATGAVSGTVADPRGNMVPGATLTLKNESGTVVTRVAADSTGHFSRSGVAAGKYTVETAAPGFALDVKTVVVAAQGSQELPITLSVGEATDTINVEAANSGSEAAQYAPLDGLLEARSARTEITSQYIQNFTSPSSDFSEILQIAPGAFSVNSNGVGLGDSKTYFRGFSDGNYDITFDGIPFEDTNSPTHHSWAFFPAPWIGGVDFDRSPGDAATIGPTPYGGSINLLSRELTADMNLRGSFSYGSFNTILGDAQFDSGKFGPGGKSAMFLDFHRLVSDGYQTYNAQSRWGGSVKYQYRFSERSVLTGFSGVLFLDTNTPNVKGPTRLQAFGDGSAANPGQYNFLLVNDPTSSLYVNYNYYHVPTDFEYIGYKTTLGKGWSLDAKPYTYQYNNHQNYATAPSTLGGAITNANCAPVNTKFGSGTQTVTIAITPCGVDKLNSYRKYGENTLASQTSKYGIFRTGLWYEWARTDRYQIPDNPITLVDDVLPNFHENFWTNSYQPYAEYEWHATSKLSLTGGFKFAHYTLDLKQYADNGSTVGPSQAIGGAFTRNYGSFNSALPSADVNYRIKSNWSVYGQFATGSVIPPSNVYDVKYSLATPGVAPVEGGTTPKPTYAKTYQAGTVIKLKKVSINADGYYSHFGNSYVSNPDPNNPSGTQYQPGGDSVSKGFEAELNYYFGRGLSFYGNGTAGSARYVSATLPSSATITVAGVAVPAGTQVPNYNNGLWVANTPSNTESLGMTYQNRSFDLGIFNKRVGPMWNDSTGPGTATVNGTTVAVKTLNQIIPIDPFNITNMFFNYTIRNGGHFDQTKLKLSFNNLFNTQQITSVTQSAKALTYTPGPADTLGLTPARSVTFTVTFGVIPKR